MCKSHACEYLSNMASWYAFGSPYASRIYYMELSVLVISTFTFHSYISNEHRFSCLNLISYCWFEAILL